MPISLMDNTKKIAISSILNEKTRKKKPSQEQKAKIKGYSIKIITDLP